MSIFVVIEYFSFNNSILSLHKPKIEENFVMMSEIKISSDPCSEHVLSYFRFETLKKILQYYHLTKRVDTNLFNMIKLFNDRSAYFSIKMSSDLQVVYKTGAFDYENWDSLTPYFVVNDKGVDYNSFIRKYCRFKQDVSGNAIMP